MAKGRVPVSEWIRWDDGSFSYYRYKDYEKYWHVQKESEVVVSSSRVRLYYYEGFRQVCGLSSQGARIAGRCAVTFYDKAKSWLLK